MTTQPVILPMTDGELRLGTRDRGWWEVSLVAEDQTTVLGADLLLSLTDGMLSRLTFAGPPAGERDGRPVSWVLTLWGRHHSLYCAFDGGDRLLYFQDVHDELVWRDRLSPAHLRRWGIVLRAARATLRL